MSKVTYTNQYEKRSLESHFQPNGLLFLTAEEDGKRAFYTDQSYFTSIVFTGNNLVEGVNSHENELTSGSISNVGFSFSLETFVKVAGNYTATEISDVVEAGTNNDVGGAVSLIRFLFAKSDTVIGSKVGDAMSGYGGKDVLKGMAGEDLINGGTGNGDKLFGGKDSDHFILVAGDGADVVGDFDLKGKDHDWVSTSGDYNLRSNKHGDVVISTEGASLTLLDVSKGEFRNNFIVDEQTFTADFAM